MHVRYDSRKDCNYGLAGDYIKCLLGAFGAGYFNIESTDKGAKFWVKTLAKAACVTYLFKHAVSFGAILQIRDTCFPKEGR